MTDHAARRRQQFYARRYNHRKAMSTTEQKIQCLKREIAMRKRVYPGRVERGAMTEFEANREIALMASILLDYENQARAERSAHMPGLFDEERP